MSTRVSGTKVQNEGFENLISAITALPTEAQDALFKPVATITRSMVKVSGGDEEAKRALEEVREKLVKAGLGGLLTVLDKEFCAAAAAGEVVERGGKRERG